MEYCTCPQAISWNHTCIFWYFNNPFFCVIFSTLVTPSGFVWLKNQLNVWTMVGWCILFYGLSDTLLCWFNVTNGNPFGMKQTLTAIFSNLLTELLKIKWTVHYWKQWICHSYLVTKEKQSWTNYTASEILCTLVTVKLLSL